MAIASGLATTISQPPAKIDFSVLEGDDLPISILFLNPDETPIILDGSHVLMQIRTNYKTPVLLTFSSDAIDPRFLITLDTSEFSNMNFLIDHDMTKNELNTGIQIYDLQVTDINGIVKTIITGKIKVIPSVTR